MASKVSSALFIRSKLEMRYLYGCSLLVFDEGLVLGLRMMDLSLRGALWRVLFFNILSFLISHITILNLSFLHFILTNPPTPIFLPTPHSYLPFGPIRPINFLDPIDIIEPISKIGNN